MSRNNETNGIMRGLIAALGATVLFGQLLPRWVQLPLCRKHERDAHRMILPDVHTPILISPWVLGVTPGFFGLPRPIHPQAPADSSRSRRGFWHCASPLLISMHPLVRRDLLRRD